MPTKQASMSSTSTSSKGPGYAAYNRLANNPMQSRDVGYVVSAATNYSETFEYVMVFPLKDGIQSDHTKDTVHRMLEAGLEVFLYKSVQEDELIALIRAPVSCGIIHVMSFVIAADLFLFFC